MARMGRNWGAMTRYRGKTEQELQYIVKDASEARDAVESIDPNHPSSGKYSDQINDALTELYRLNQLSRRA